MGEQQSSLEWEETALKKYHNMIRRIPLFHRDIADQVVTKKATQNAQERESQRVEECDILRAFFSEVPMTFYGLMIRLFEEVGFDYNKYDPSHKQNV